MSNHGLSEEELALLTEEERAGLENDDDIDDDDQDVDTETQAGKPDPDDDDDDDDTDPDAGKDKDKPAAQDDPAGKDAEPPADQQQEEQPQGKNAQPVPLFKSDVPADIEAKFQDIDTREEALVEKFEDGDLTTREYNAELRKLNKERSDLEWVQRKAELSQESSQSQREQQWFNELNTFLPQHPAISKNETTWNSFDAVLRRVTAATMEAGGFPGRADIEKAYKQWADDLGIATDAAPAKDKDAQQPAAKKDRNVPPTLGKIPAASGTETDDGKYAHLDRLAETDPVAYEDALAKLSPSEWDEYSQSN